MRQNSASLVFLLLIVFNFLAQMDITDAAAAATAENQRHDGALLKRQNSKWHESFFKEMCTSHVTWGNACRGQWVGDEATTNAEASKNIQIPHYEVLSILKNAISMNYKELQSNTSDINISDTNRTWARSKRFYKFLPRLNSTSKLRLRAWHRQMQIYAGGFTYLRRAQLYYDYKRYDEESSMSRTLKKFKNAALSILCEIEAAINITNKHSKRPLRIANPQTMQRILKFQTKTKTFDTNSETCTSELMQFDEEPTPVNAIDLKFAKFRFLSHLRAMRKFLKERITKRTNLSRSSSGSRSRSFSSYVSSDSSYSQSDNSMLNSRSFEKSLNSQSAVDSAHVNINVMERKSVELHTQPRHRRHRKHHKAHQSLLSFKWV